MKKKYVKPEAHFVKFELSEAIASCGVQLYQNHVENSCVKNGIFDAFSLTGDKSCDVPLNAYCYFTATSEGKIGLMNS
jgi:hypothetical protein